MNNFINSLPVTNAVAVATLCRKAWQTRRTDCRAEEEKDFDELRKKKGDENDD